MLRLTNACVGERLGEVSLLFEPGQRWVVLGPNGAGKSTLLKVAMGLWRPSRGTAALDDDDVSSLTRRQMARACAWVPQATDDAEGFTGLELALLGRLAHVGALGLTSTADRELAQQLFTSLSASHLVDKPLAQASGGERRLAFLVRALLQAPRFLFLDEPTAFLDLKFALETLRLVRERCERGLCAVVVLHDLNVAAQFATHAVLLKGGKVLHAGKAADVLTAPHLSALFEVDVSRVGTDEPTFAVKRAP